MIASISGGKTHFSTCLIGRLPNKYSESHERERDLARRARQTDAGRPAHQFHFISLDRFPFKGKSIKVDHRLLINDLARNRFDAYYCAVIEHKISDSIF